MQPLLSDEEKISELKHKLTRVKMELESTKMVAKRKLGENEQSQYQLLKLLKKAKEERDEAVEHLQRILLLTNYRVFTSTSQPAETLRESSTPSQFHGNSYCNNFMSSRSTTNYKQPNILQEYLKMDKTPSLGGYAAMDAAATLATDRLLLRKAKPLPEKGKLLQAVQAAGPLLKTLLGDNARIAPPPQPRWRNPPPISSCLENHKAALPVLKSLKSVKSLHIDHGVPVAVPSSSSTMYHDFARGSGSSNYCLDGGKPIHGGMSNPNLISYPFSIRNCES